MAADETRRETAGTSPPSDLTGPRDQELCPQRFATVSSNAPGTASFNRGPIIVKSSPGRPCRHLRIARAEVQRDIELVAPPPPSTAPVPFQRLDQGPVASVAASSGA